MRISDWSSDVCSSDLVHAPRRRQVGRGQRKGVLITLAHRRRACGPGFAGFGLGKTRGVIAGTQAQGHEQSAQAKRQRRHRTSWKTSETRAQSLTGRRGLNKRNYRLVFEHHFTQITRLLFQGLALQRPGVLLLRSSAICSDLSTLTVVDLPWLEFDGSTPESHVTLTR